MSAHVAKPVVLNLERCGSGPPVLYLHGFPEMARFWRPLMEALGDSYEGIAPDLRGYGASPRPADVSAYAVETLLEDIVALFDRLALERCHIVGHDWGGVLAWWLASRHGTLVSSLAIFNAPHPAAFQRRLETDPVQRQRSQYVRALQRADAAAELLREGPAALWTRLRGVSSGFDVADRAHYLAAWEKGLEGAVAWYRASPFIVPNGDSAPASWVAREPFRIACRTMVVWGQRDSAFVPELADDSADYAASATVHRLPDAGHNPPREATAVCAQLLRDFLKENDADVTRETRETNA